MNQILGLCAFVLVLVIHINVINANEMRFSSDRSGSQVPEFSDSWSKSWYNCKVPFHWFWDSNWEKRDEEAAGTFTFTNGRFSYIRMVGDEVGARQGQQIYCYLTIKGAEHFGITLDAGPEYDNIGVKSCWNKKSGGKKYQEGVNPYCGKSGLCCRYKKIKDQESGCRNWNGDKEGKGDPSKNYHHCIQP